MYIPVYRSYSNEACWNTNQILILYILVSQLIIICSSLLSKPIWNNLIHVRVYISDFSKVTSDLQFFSYVIFFGENVKIRNFWPQTRVQQLQFYIARIHQAANNGTMLLCWNPIWPPPPSWKLVNPLSPGWISFSMFLSFTETYLGLSDTYTTLQQWLH